MASMSDMLTRLIESGYQPDDGPSIRRKKAAMTLVPLIIGPAAFVWGSIYFFLDHPLSGSIPMSYSIISAFSLLYYFKTKRTAFLEASQLILVLLLPFLLMWSLGGFFYGSTVMIWALFTPIAASIFMGKRAASLWFIAYFILLLLSGLLQGYLSSHVEPIPVLFQNIFFLLNLGAGSAGLYLLVSYSSNLEKQAIENLNLEKQKLETQKEELRTINEHLAKARIAAEKATVAKSEFLANMSHELRTPMNGVIGMLHLLMHTNLDKKQKNHVEKAHLSAENLLRILNDILDFSKIEAGKLELEETPFYIKDVISNMVTLFKLKAEEKGIQFSVNVNDDVPRLLNGDSLRIGQVLNNLSNNAIKFTPEGGAIQISVALKDETENDVTLLFSIADTGIGISKEQQGKLFQAFSQADTSTTRRYGGTGLGLTISNNVVRMMGGEIWVNSEENKGSTFYFTIRVKKQDEGELNESSMDAVDSTDVTHALKHLKGAKILLVEDNEINQELAMELLVMNGISVETAVNGEEALALVHSHTYDGVLMDCQMPVMDGYQATRKLREEGEYQDLPVLALTANAMKGDREKVLAAGMNDHIAKPINSNTLFLTMAKWITPSTPVDS